MSQWREREEELPLTKQNTGMGDPLSTEEGEQQDTRKKRSLTGHMPPWTAPRPTLAHCRRPCLQSPHFSGSCEVLFCNKNKRGVRFTV